jgi:hypothetical protein
MEGLVAHHRPSLAQTRGGLLPHHRHLPNTPLPRSNVRRRGFLPTTTPHHPSLARTRDGGLLPTTTAFLTLPRSNTRRRWRVLAAQSQGSRCLVSRRPVPGFSLPGLSLPTPPSLERETAEGPRCPPPIRLTRDGGFTLPLPTPPSLDVVAQGSRCLASRCPPSLERETAEGFNCPPPTRREGMYPSHRVIFFFSTLRCRRLS